jgi:hypothetical protein
MNSLTFNLLLTLTFHTQIAISHQTITKVHMDVFLKTNLMNFHQSHILIQISIKHSIIIPQIQKIFLTIKLFTNKTKTCNQQIMK